ncbi:MAG: hypothetical protein IIA88_03070 [Bacteroidetes bacterium]|nr:hypothetical protein [Bacteroidota bacterium]
MLKNCTGWTSEGGLQEQPSNCPTVLCWQQYGAERIGKRVGKTYSGVNEGDERK